MAYKNFINRLDSMVNAVAPFKTVRTQVSEEHKNTNNTSEWFDVEIAGKIHIHGKLYKIFKLTKLHVDEDICKKAQNVVQNLI